MKSCVIIPAINEGPFIREVISGFINQSIPPHKLIIVDDGSSDNTHEEAIDVSKNHSWISIVKKEQTGSHFPGKKVIDAFYYGLNIVSIDEFDLIGKFDADILLPKNYFENILGLFSKDEKMGIASGNLYIQKKDKWIYENISEKTKTRGPIKLYRKKCFEEIGGLKPAVGWDTLDELLAQYHGWKVATDPSLHVKHLKPTGKNYSKAARYSQGRAFYQMRYGFLLSFIASAKLAFKKNKVFLAKDYLTGYSRTKKERVPFLVSEDEGKFIRKLRWKNIKKKFLVKSFTQRAQR